MGLALRYRRASVGFADVGGGRLQWICGVRSFTVAAPSGHHNVWHTGTTRVVTGRRLSVTVLFLEQLPYTGQPLARGRRQVMQVAAHGE